MFKKKSNRPKKNNPALYKLLNLQVADEKEFFVENLSMLISSGMGLLDTLEALKRGVRTKRMKKLIDEVIANIESGRTIHQALKEIYLFDSHVISLIKIGESSGKLVENLDVVVVQQRKDRMFKSKIRSAMLYPILVVSLTLIVGLGIAWFVLPRLTHVYKQLDMELPTITKVVIAIGDFMDAHAAIFIPSLLVGLVVLYFFTFIYHRTKFIGQALMFAFPGIKMLIQQIELARFGYILGTLLNAGMPIDEALDSLSEVTSFYNYKKFFRYLHDSIEEGRTFAETFASYKHLKAIVPVPVQQMIMSGEQSGGLSSVLFRLGKTYEYKVDMSSRNLTIILEPILLVIVWFGVVMVALAVIMPIYSLIGGISQINTTSKNPPPAPVVQEQVTNEANTNIDKPSLDISVDDLVPLKPESAPVIIPEVVTELELPKLQILPTGIGYLNVRDEPNGELLARVIPGDIVLMTDEENGWYEIRTDGIDSGWISAQYATMLEK